MEFTESFPLTQNSSSTGQLILSPSSDLIAISEFYAADRRIASNIEEVLPAWSVRIVETESLGTLREFQLKLPVNSFMSDCGKNSGSSENNLKGNKRQFVMGGLKSSIPSGLCTVTSPQIGPSLIMEWSPDGRFLAAWPQDTSIIFICCPGSSGSNLHEPILRIQELTAVGIASFKWTPDSTGILVNLKYGMGIKYWRLDCKYPVHLFPYPKSVKNENDGMVFSEDGKYLAILHRRDAVDHIAIYTRQNEEDWKVLRWLNVPDDLNLEGISFAHGIGQSQYDQIPELYAWETVSKFQFLVYDGDGNLKCHVTPEIIDTNCTFGIKKWKWSRSGRLAVFSDSQEVLYLWNAVNHKLMGKICLNQLEALKQQNPIVFREQQMRESTCFKYEASYTFPLQSQIVTSAVVNSYHEDLQFELSHDGEFLAVHHPSKYSNCIWIFDLKSFRLKALLLQLKPIQDFQWHASKNVLTVSIGSDHIYFWQPDGTHCIPYPRDDYTANFNIKSMKWFKNQKTILMNSNDAFCLGLPEIL